MKLKDPLLAVRDMERSKAFYREVLGLHVVMDFGANVTLTGGLCLQTLDTWAGFLGKAAEEIRFGGDDSEVYFEEDDFDGFLNPAGRTPGHRLRPPAAGAPLGPAGGAALRPGPPYPGDRGEHEGRVPPVPGPGHDAGADRRADGSAPEIRHRLSALRALRARGERSFPLKGEI